MCWCDCNTYAIASEGACAPYGREVRTVVSGIPVESFVGEMTLVFLNVSTKWLGS